MSPHAAAETVDLHGCRIVLRRVEGPHALEVFIHGQPIPGAVGAGKQAEAIYRAVVAVLETEGGGFASVVCETLFLRSLSDDLDSVRAARRSVLEGVGAASHRPATTEIEQAPLDASARLEVSAQAVIPHGASLDCEVVSAPSTCDCADCDRRHGLKVHTGAEVHFHAGALYGAGQGAFEQALDLFEAAEALLRRAGMTFGDVVRTWIHLREIDRDYAALNRARRVFFEARGIDPPPASTGIGGGPAAGAHDLCLGVYAVQSARPVLRTVMTSPTLNEAETYGADFVRGLRLEEANKVALLVSGTASIDEAGRTAHPEDFEAQTDRMLVNLAALLEGQGASFGDVVSAVTYLKRPGDAERLHAKLREAGFEGFPNPRVAAAVCRPDLLCETELLAVRHREA